MANDVRDAADAYCFLLNAAGYRVSRAYDGLTALSLAMVTKPDVAIINDRMPGLTGLQVLRELRGAGVRTKVILSSAAGVFNEALVGAVEAGAEACIRQPCPPDRLLALLADILDLPRRTPSL